MVKHSRRYNEAVQKVERGVTYEPQEAIDLLKSLPAPKFDETVTVCVRLGIPLERFPQPTIGR